MGRNRERTPRPKKPKSQLAIAILLVAGIAVGVAAVERLPRIGAPAFGGGGSARSGAWFCPHGGGKGWNVWISVANPTDEPVSVRISSDTEEGPAAEPEVSEIPAASTVTVRAQARTRGSGTMVEYFDGTAVAGWVAEAGKDGESGEESGVAAEPCTADAGKRILLAGASTAQQQDPYVVIMNPFGAPASYSLRLFTEKDRPVETAEESLRPHHAVAVRLNGLLLGEPAIGTEVVVGLGRVAAGNLDLVTGKGGGARASVGWLAPDPSESSQTVVLLGGRDEDTSGIAVVNPWESSTELMARLLTADQEQTATGLEGVSIPAESASTRTVDAQSPSSLALTSGPLAVARRSFSEQGDDGATTGVLPATSWVVLPAVTQTGPFEPRLVIANPGTQPADVSLRVLPENESKGGLTLPSAVVAPGTTEAIELPEDAVHSAVVVTADVPVASGIVGYSDDGRGYAVSAGVPMPS